MMLRKTFNTPDVWPWGYKMFTCFCSCVKPNNASFTGKYEEHRDVNRSGDLLLKNGFETRENSFRVDIMKKLR